MLVYEKIRQIRKAKGLKQEQIAEKLDMSPAIELEKQLLINELQQKEMALKDKELAMQQREIENLKLPHVISCTPNNELALLLLR